MYKESSKPLTMDGSTTGRLAEDGHVVWVSAEVADVVADPLKRLDGVLHAVVSGRVRVVRAQEAQRSQTVVDADHEDVLVHQVIGTVRKAVAVLALE